MKKLTLTALMTAAALSSLAFAAPMRGHHQQVDYTAEQSGSVQYTGSVIIAPQPSNVQQETDAARQARLASYARITPATAARLAFAQAPGNVSSVRLGVDKGVLVYEVMVGQTEVTLNALNGAQWTHNENVISTQDEMAEPNGGRE